ncbi:unnamed protein product [Mycena citricolor]|uniref:Uncharacterized protein n=1 Tax=Mycena citricolor TaxID=2018698 RepID=A0AAD2Q5B5_9AGAR|nr:unnamed protein product [Mycena citricolor]
MTGSSGQQFLLLIENSSLLAGYWRPLRTQYLPNFIQQLRGAHPSCPVPAVSLTRPRRQNSRVVQEKIFVAASRPSPFDLAPNPRQSSNLEADLTELQFNYDSDNALAIAHIRYAAQFLACQSARAVRHLIIVAATCPLDYGGEGPDPWQQLARSLRKERVHIHLALTSHLRTSPFIGLFEQAKQEQHTEEPLWLQTYSTDFLFRVCVPLEPAVHLSSASKTSETSQHLPSDMYTTKALTDPCADPPSIVAKLQQVHGLTKKKVYGAKPVQPPFIKDDHRPTRRSLTLRPIDLPPETSPAPLLTRRTKPGPSVVPPGKPASTWQSAIANTTSSCQMGLWQDDPVSNMLPSAVDWLSPPSDMFLPLDAANMQLQSYPYFDDLPSPNETLSPVSGTSSPPFPISPIDPPRSGLYGITAAGDMDAADLHHQLHYDTQQMAYSPLIQAHRPANAVSPVPRLAGCPPTSISASHGLCPRQRIEPAVNTAAFHLDTPPHAGLSSLSGWAG